MYCFSLQKVPVKQPENQFKSEETVVIPRDDGPGLDLSIFEPRGKRKCVIELEERKESKKAWWEGEDEIEKDSDEKVKEEDEDDSCEFPFSYCLKRILTIYATTLSLQGQLSDWFPLVSNDVAGRQ